MKRLLFFFIMPTLLIAGGVAGFVRDGGDMNKPNTAADHPDLEMAMQHYESGDFTAALTGFQALAQAGDAKAQTMLAMMHIGGLVPEDQDEDDMAREAGALLLAAAGQGDAEAQYYLGHFYRKAGFGEHDYVNAAKWFRAAAIQNHSDAQFELASLYARGTLDAEDSIDKALMWLFVSKRSNNFEDKEPYERKYRRFLYQTGLDVSALPARQRAQAETAATRCYRSGYTQCD